uniref:Uncharacterized protein n=1 Tax=Triticum urartu TaxID=4572 RepID=A0A8R7UL24_TRIUA
HAPAPPPSSVQPLADGATNFPATNHHVQELRNHEISFPTQLIGRIHPEAVAIVLLPKLLPPSFVVDYVAVTASPASPTPPARSA